MHHSSALDHVLSTGGHRIASSCTSLEGTCTIDESSLALFSVSFQTWGHQDLPPTWVHQWSQWVFLIGEGRRGYGNHWRSKCQPLPDSTYIETYIKISSTVSRCFAASVVVTALSINRHFFCFRQKLWLELVSQPFWVLQESFWQHSVFIKKRDQNGARNIQGE